MKKNIKVLLTILFIPLVIFSIIKQSFAEEIDNGFITAPGELKISFTKIWEGVTEGETLPDVKVTLYKYLGESFDINKAIKLQEVTLNENDYNWKYDFDISNEPLVDTTTNEHYKFIVVEEMPDGYREVSRVDPQVDFTPPTINPSEDIYSPNSSLNISLDGMGNGTGHFVATTLTNSDKDKNICGPTGKGKCDILVWSENQLSQSERMLITSSLKNVNANYSKAVYEVDSEGNIIQSNVYFIYGTGTIGGMKVTEESVTFDATCNWSHVLIQTYKKSTASANVASITNGKRIDLEVEKVWNDSNNILNLRPTEITIQLLKNGVEYGESVKLNETNSWKYTFEKLNEYEDGVLVDYDIVELEVDGYDTSIDRVGNKITITNTKIVTPTKINVEKVWEWNSIEPQDNPPGVVVELYYRIDEFDNNPKKIAEVILNKENNWKYTFESGTNLSFLPANYIYEVKEKGFDISDESEKQFYEEFFITDYSHTGNDWIITNTCTASYILPETGNSGGLIYSIVIMVLLGTPIVYLIYSFVKKRYASWYL